MAIHVEDREGVRLLRMEHGSAQVLDLEYCATLRAAFESLRDEPPRAVVLTGRKSIFSVGVDLVRLRDGDEAHSRKFLEGLDAMFASLVRVPCPVVAAVNGHAIAGGCVLALACDVRVAAEGSAKIGVPELSVGVPFPPVAFELVRAAVDDATLRSLVYLGTSMTVGAAASAGLVDEVCAPERLLDRAFEIAARLAAIPRAAFEISKRQVRARAWALAGDERGVPFPEIAAAWDHPEVRAAVSAYVAKTLRK